MAVKLNSSFLYTKHSVLKFIEISSAFFILRSKDSVFLLGQLGFELTVVISAQLDFELTVVISAHNYNQKSFGFLFEFA